MSITLKDIALAAGVSIGTVDRALNNRGRISTETATKIRELAVQMGYQTNKFASGLSKQIHHHKIAIILHIMGNDFFDGVLQGIQKAEQEFHDYGISLEIYPCKNFDANAQLENINLAIKNKVDAMIIVPINHPIIEKKLNQLCSENFPIVFLVSHLPNVPALSAVRCDHFRSGRIAGKLSTLIFKKDTQMLTFFPSSLMLGNDIRKQGFIHYFDTNPHQIHLGEIKELNNNYDDDVQLIIHELSINPHIDSILYCGNAKVILDAIAYVDRPIQCICFDLFAETEKALMDGRIAATITQDTIEEGYQAVYVLAQYFISGIIPPKNIFTESRIILAECID